jgi:hypothetical protein
MMKVPSPTARVWDVLARMSSIARPTLAASLTSCRVGTNRLLSSARSAESS